MSETQNKLIYILNNEDIKYLEKMNISLEQITKNKNEKKMVEFIEEYNKLMQKSFDDDADFENKYNLFMAQKLLEKSNKYIKENILDNLINNYFDEEIQNIDNLYQKINSQNNEDINTLKANFDYIINENNLDEEEKKVSKTVNNANNTKNNTNTNANNIVENTHKEKEKEVKPPKIEQNQVVPIEEEKR